MNDILPPKRNIQPQQPQRPQTPPMTDVKPPQTLIEQPPPPLLLETPRRRSRARIILWVIVGFIAFLVVAAASAFMWYNVQLTPAASGKTDRIQVKIIAGSSPDQIGQLLEEKKIIRSSLAFDIYTRLSNTRGGLQAGTYSLSPSDSTEQIVAHLVDGKTDELIITFLPGATLAENRAGLIRAGYSEAEVDTALNKTYDHPLFADKPASADLEGYIYGETYHFDSNTTVEEILKRTFDEYYTQLTHYQLIDAIKQHGLTLYQGITLASIIQREVSSPADQKQVAQVFYTRLAQDMPLGSDVTYQYAAKKLGVTPSPSLDSPYNTRKFGGLPPGPIAVPGLSALQAVAAPAGGDYLFFLSGDDNKTYFSHTSNEHDANVRDHCQIKCAIS
jgi:UPF0755 protein